MSRSEPVRVLIMDDDVGQARLAQRVLERAGYAVGVAGDGDIGLSLYETGDYDVLMVDHQMPRQGGLDVLRILATRGVFPPTIMVTGHGTIQSAVEAMQQGAFNYLLKPLDLKQLRAVVDNARALVRPGVDYLAFGPNDLSFDLEARPEYPLRTVDDCMRHVAEQVAGSGVRLGHVGLDVAVATHSRGITTDRGVELAASIALQ